MSAEAATLSPPPSDSRRGSETFFPASDQQQGEGDTIDLSLRPFEVPDHLRHLLVLPTQVTTRGNDDEQQQQGAHATATTTFHPSRVTPDGYRRIVTAHAGPSSASQDTQSRPPYERIYFYYLLMLWPLLLAWIVLEIVYASWHFLWKLVTFLSSDVSSSSTARAIIEPDRRNLGDDTAVVDDLPTARWSFRLAAFRNTGRWIGLGSLVDYDKRRSRRVQRGSPSKSPDDSCPSDDRRSCNGASST